MADPSFLTNSRIAAKVEAAPGTLEGTGTWTVLPVFTDGFGIDPKKNFVDAPIVDATRQKTSSVGGPVETTFTIVTPLNNEPGVRFLLESALFGAFSTNTIVSAATRKTFSIEQKNELGATDAFRRIAGCVVNSVSFDMPNQGFIKCNFNILGQAYSVATTELGSAYTAITGLEAMATSLPGTSIVYNGTALAGVTDFSVSMENGLASAFAFGATSADHLTQDVFRLTGNGKRYLRDNLIATAFLAEIPDDLVLVLKSSDISPILNTCTMTIPKTKFTSAPVDVAGFTLTDGLAFRAEYDSGILSKVQLAFSAV